MTNLDFESAQLELLTEALRAGPGTPQWRDAMASIETVPGASASADEYKLLCAARERLASGRQYREVRAGGGFTRKVFDAIENEESVASSPSRALLSANVIAAISAAAILAILAIVLLLVLPRGSGTGQNPAAAGDDLTQTYFVNTRASSNFETELGMEWGAFGPLQVQARGGLRPVLGGVDGVKGSTFRGGGVIYERAFPADQPFAIEATVRLIKPSDDAVVQVFVADDRNFGEQSATSPHELVWSLRGGDASVVLPDGTVATGAAAAAPAGKVRAGQPIDLRIAVSATQAQVQTNGRRTWRGKSQLDPAKPRIAGVRFLARGKITDADAPVIESVKVLVPQKQ